MAKKSNDTVKRRRFGKLRLLLYTVLTALVLSSILLALFFFSPDPASGYARKHVQAGLQGYVDGLTQRARAGKSTGSDRRFMYMVYKSMIIFGGIPYPEAAEILDHYLFGDGGDLQVDASHYRKSPVVQRAIRGKKEGRIGPVTLRIKDDPRLAYGVNGFYIDIKRDGGELRYRLHQRMVFDNLKSPKKIATRFYLGKFSFLMQDSLVWVFKDQGCCKPFTAYAEWSEPAH